MHYYRFTLVGLLLPGFVAAGLAAETGGADQAFSSLDPEYAACVDKIGQDPEQVRFEAKEWIADGGGAPAIHCLALADLAAGHPKLAAIRLSELAERAGAGDDLVRARILSQAALAALEANEQALAEEALAKAQAHAPGAKELKLTEAEVHAAAERWQSVVDAVSEAEDAGFVSVDAFVTRARAYMALGDNHAAARDVIEALKIDSFNVDALVLRGELAQRGVTINANYRRKTGEE